MVGVMTSLGFTVSNADEALYYKFNSDGSYLIMGSATDDFTIVADANATANSFLDDLAKQVELVHLGNISWLLSTTVSRNLSEKTISLGQTAYIEQLCVVSNSKTLEPFPHLFHTISISHQGHHTSHRLFALIERRELIENSLDLLCISPS